MISFTSPRLPSGPAPKGRVGADALVLVEHDRILARALSEPSPTDPIERIIPANSRDSAEPHRGVLADSTGGRTTSDSGVLRGCSGKGSGLFSCIGVRFRRQGVSRWLGGRIGCPSGRRSLEASRPRMRPLKRACPRRWDVSVETSYMPAGKQRPIYTLKRNLWRWSPSSWPRSEGTLAIPRRPSWAAATVPVPGFEGDLDCLRRLSSKNGAFLAARRTCPAWRLRATG